MAVAALGCGSRPEKEWAENEGEGVEKEEGEPAEEEKGSEQLNRVLEAMYSTSSLFLSSSFSKFYWFCNSLASSRILNTLPFLFFFI